MPGELTNNLPTYLHCYRRLSLAKGIVALMMWFSDGRIELKYYCLPVI